MSFICYLFPFYGELLECNPWIKSWSIVCGDIFKYTEQRINTLIEWYCWFHWFLPWYVSFHFVQTWWCDSSPLVHIVWRRTSRPVFTKCPREDCCKLQHLDFFHFKWGLFFFCFFYNLSLTLCWPSSS